VCCASWIAGKAGVLDGDRRYGTAFGGTPFADISRALVKAGYHYAGAFSAPQQQQR